MTSPEGSGYAAAQDRVDRLVRAGVAVFFVGVVALAAVLGPFAFGSENRPTWLNVVAIVSLVTGLGLALGGLVTSVRSPAPDDDDCLVDDEQSATEHYPAAQPGEVSSPAG